MSEIENAIESYLQIDDILTKKKEHIKDLTIQKKVLETKIMDLMGDKELYMETSGRKWKINTVEIKKKKTVKDIQDVLKSYLNTSDLAELNDVINTPKEVLSKKVLKKYK